MLRIGVLLIYEWKLNAKALVQALYDDSMSSSINGVLLKEIRDWMIKVSIGKVEFAPRSQNKVAHNIVAFALNLS